MTRLSNAHNIKLDATSSFYDEHMLIPNERFNDLQTGNVITFRQNGTLMDRKMILSILVSQ